MKICALRIERTRHGITQFDLSLKSGIPQKRISLHENGFNVLKPHEKDKIANVLGVAVCDVFPVWRCGHE